MNELDETNDIVLTKRRMRTALRNIESIIEKIPPETPYVMSAVYGISLALGELDALADMDVLDQNHFERRLMDLEDAIEFFDLVAPQDLAIMSDDELAKYVRSPEMPSDNDVESE